MNGRARRSNAAFICALGAIILAAYANSFQTGFVIDNEPLLLNDPRLRAATWENVRQIFRYEYWWPTMSYGVYRPVATLSYWFNYAMLGNAGNPVGWHVVNFLLHWVNAGLVFVLLRHLMEGRAPASPPMNERTRGARPSTASWPAFLAAALFAVHPVGTEAVTNIIGRTDLLSTFAVLAALLCYVRGSEGSKWWWAGMGAVTAMGLLSKENAYVIIAVIFLYELTFHPQRLRQFWKPLLVLAPVYAGAWMARAWVLRNSPPPVFPFVDNPLVGADWWTARWTALKVFGRYLGLMVWPGRLSCDYSYDQIPVRGMDAGAVVSLLVVIALAATAVWAYRRQKAVFFLMAFSIGALLPTSNLLVLIGNIMGERYLYLSLVGFAGCVVLATRALHRRWAIVVAVLVVAGGVRTFVRNRDWVDNLHIWRSAVFACPDAFKTYQGYAGALYRAGQLDDAITCLERSRAILEKRPLLPRDLSYEVYSDLGMLYVTKGNYRQAVTVLERGAEISRAWMEASQEASRRRGQLPLDDSEVEASEIYNNLGIAHLNLGNNQIALNQFTRLQRLTPSQPRGYVGAAFANHRLGRLEEALVCVLAGMFLDNQNQAAASLLLQLCHSTGRDAAVADGRVDLKSQHMREPACEAFRRLVANLNAARMTDAAKRIEETSTKEVGCSPASN